MVNNSPFVLTINEKQLLSKMKTFVKNAPSTMMQINPQSENNGELQLRFDLKLRFKNCTQSTCSA